jgi:hypothetical protein
MYEATELRGSSTQGVPLLDASSLPAAEDWTLLEAFHADVNDSTDFEPGFDRCGRLRLAAAFDD